MKKYILFLIALGVFSGCTSKELSFYEPMLEDTYEEYLSELESLRSVFYEEDLKAPDFFMFGMGRADKYIYKSGKLYDLDGRVHFVWDVEQEVIRPNDYEVRLKLRESDSWIKLKENETGIWLIQDTVGQCLSNSDTVNIQLPDFKGYRYPQVLKVLLHEVLINIRNGIPYPNVLVYHTPWYRDAFVMAISLKETHNEHLIKSWVKSLEDVYDLNVGLREADNLGQILYLVSLDSTLERNSKLIEKVLHEAHDISVRSEPKISDYYIQGLTDGASLPVYQTFLLKYGLKNLSMVDSFSISLPADYYTDLLWMYKDKEASYIKYLLKSLYRKSLKQNFEFPYLDWAKAHYHGSTFAAMSAQAYPLSWEYYGNRADMDRMSLVDSSTVKRKILYPHAWHAAEMFLYLLEFKVDNQT